MLAAGKNILLLVAVPPGVVTVITPVEPEPTTAVMVVGFTTVNEDAAVPPKLTVVAPVKLVPVMVTVDPGQIAEEQLNSDFYRWLYTALTRASETVFLVNFPDSAYDSKK